MSKTLEYMRRIIPRFSRAARHIRTKIMPRFSTHAASRRQETLDSTGDTDRPSDDTREDTRKTSPYWLGYNDLPEDFFILDCLGEGSRGL